MPDPTIEAQAQELANSSGAIIVILETSKELLYTRPEHLKDVLEFYKVLRLKYLYPATRPSCCCGPRGWTELE